jgi:serine/threonine protein kinase/Flp pilus assembly protein TadD
MIGQTISHYKILEKLGEGGMGVVYKAEDTKLKRTVALKFLPRGLTSDPDAKARFVREAQAASALDHPNVCTVYEVDETNDGTCFIAMAYYQGQSLQQKIKQSPLKIDEAIGLAIQVASGLKKAHESGIVHRDIKPANILVTTEGIPKIVDFGLAKLRGRTKLSRESASVGTVEYMSPEQALGEVIDNRTDIWALGCVIYEMLTGRVPFQGDYEQAIVYSILNTQPEPVTGLRSGIPMELERIVTKAMEKRKGDRYQHVEDMIVDLRRLQNMVPASVPSPPRSSKIPWLVAAAAVALAAVAAYLLYPKSNPTFVTGKSVAVLPFTNMSDSKEEEYFSDGITDDIIAQLSKITDLKVISRTSVMQYKGIRKNVRDIGRELDVATILEGSVRRSGNQLRIVAQLIDANNEGHLWADTYDEAMTQVCAIQSDVAQRIAAALQAKLSPTEKGRIERAQTNNTEAYQLYLKGRFYWNKRRVDDLKTAIEYFGQATERDSTYALAYAGLASAYVLLPNYGISQAEKSYMKAWNAAMKALEIDSALAEAHTVLGEIAQDQYYDWAAAEKHFRKAIALDPGYPTAHQWYSTTLGHLGRLDEALSEARKAQELDPLSLIINTNVGEVYYVMRQFERAVEQFRNALALDPNFSWAHLELAFVYELQRRFDEAVAELETTKRTAGKNPVILGYLGCGYAMAGRKKDALNVLDELLRLVRQGNAVSLGVAATYHGLGDKEKTFEWLEKAYEARETELLYLGTDPQWDDLRTEPRCIALSKKMGLRK